MDRRPRLKSVVSPSPRTPILIGDEFTRHCALLMKLGALKPVLDHDSFLTSLSEITKKYIMPGVVDNLFKGDPFYKVMKGTRFTWHGDPITPKNIDRVYKEAMDG